MTEATKWLAGINAVLGLWLIAAPFVFSGVPQTSVWNAVIVGALIAIIGGYNWYLTTQDKEVSTSGAGLNTLLGLWLIAAPFLFNPGTTMLWNNVIVGAAVAILAGYNTYVANQARTAATAEPA